MWYEKKTLEKQHGVWLGFNSIYGEQSAVVTQHLCEMKEGKEVGILTLWVSCLKECGFPGL